MATTRKFLFDVSFDDTDARTEPDVPEIEEPQPPAITEDDVARARAEGVAEGRAAGEHAERQRTERLAADAADRLAGRLADLESVIATIGTAAERRAVECGLAATRKLVPELLRRDAVGEIEGLIRTSLRDMIEEPRLVLRVSDGILDLIKPRIDVLTMRSGFAGRVVILAEDGMLDGDCRIEWADGGVERSAARLSAEIEAAVIRALSDVETETRAQPGLEIGT